MPQMIFKEFSMKIKNKTKTNKLLSINIEAVYRVSRALRIRRVCCDVGQKLPLFAQCIEFQVFKLIA